MFFKVTRLLNVRRCVTFYVGVFFSFKDFFREIFQSFYNIYCTLKNSHNKYVLEFFFINFYFFLAE